MSQPLVTTIWARYAAPAITPVVPFTYSDNITYLRLLQALREKLDELIISYGDFQKAVEAWAEQAEAELKQQLAEFKETLGPELEQVLKEYVDGLIATIEQTGVCSDPTRGDMTVSVRDAVWHAYDDTRYWALYAKDHDDLERTALEIDELEETAKHYDLYGTGGILNIEFGDYARGGTR